MKAALHASFPTLKNEVGTSGEVGKSEPPPRPPLSTPPFRGGMLWGSGVGSGSAIFEVGEIAGASR
jgi:hypothetical protein